MTSDRSSFGRILAAGLLALLTAGCTGEGDWEGQSSGTSLSACGAEGSIFDRRSSESLPFDRWDDTYHGYIDQVVTAHLEGLGSVHRSKLQCTAADYPTLLPASDALRDMARFLPPWQSRNALDALSEADMTSVLLEWLRVYECALAERENNLSVILLNERGSSMNREEFNNLRDQEQAVIRRELTLARPVLDRTLTILGGYDRLRPLSMDIECLKRTSLDLRNTLGLAADAVSCLPRVWDARGSIRDIPLNP